MCGVRCAAVCEASGASRQMDDGAAPEIAAGWRCIGARAIARRALFLTAQVMLNMTTMMIRGLGEMLQQYRNLARAHAGNRAKSARMTVAAEAAAWLRGAAAGNARCGDGNAISAQPRLSGQGVGPRRQGGTLREAGTVGGGRRGDPLLVEAHVLTAAAASGVGWRLETRVGGGFRLRAQQGRRRHLRTAPRPEPARQMTRETASPGESRACLLAEGYSTRWPLRFAL